MAPKITPEKAQQMYDEHVAILQREYGQEAVDRFLKRFPTHDAYIDWLDYTSTHHATPQHKRVNLAQIEEQYHGK
jgi:hypothetical protein